MKLLLPKNPVSLSISMRSELMKRNISISGPIADVPVSRILFSRNWTTITMPERIGKNSTSVLTRKVVFLPFLKAASVRRTAIYIIKKYVSLFMGPRT